MKLALSETPKTGFLTTRPMWFKRFGNFPYLLTDGRTHSDYSAHLRVAKVIALGSVIQPMNHSRPHRLLKFLTACVGWHFDSFSVDANIVDPDQADPKGAV